MKNELSNAAAAMGRKGGLVKTEAKKNAARANGATGGRPLKWHPAPQRGCTNRLAEIYKYTVVRFSDRAERFTDRKPRPGICSSGEFGVWDNRENCKID